MKNLELIIDLIEHPERYDDARVEQILADDEAMQAYDAILETRMAIDHDTAKHVDVDEAWAKFATQNAPLLEAHRTATRRHWHKAAAAIVGVVAMSGVAFAAIHIATQHRLARQAEPVATAATANVPTVASDTTATADGLASGTPTAKPAVRKTFENVGLADMLREIAAYYGMEVEYRNEAVRQLRYYYQWDSASGIKAVVDELNHSERVTLTVDGKKIVVE